MIIRTERASDHETIYELVKSAFDHAEHSDGTEHDLVNLLRGSEAFVPELSLVAEVDGKTVGHIQFTEVHVGPDTALALAPLSVLPAYQHQGIGTELIRVGHEKAAQLGYGYSIVLGSEQYYPRMGYRTAKEFGIQPPFDVPEENFMAFRLSENAASIHGLVQYAKEFGID